MKRTIDKIRAARAKRHTKNTPAPAPTDTEQAAILREANVMVALMDALDHAVAEARSNGLANQTINEIVDRWQTNRPRFPKE